MTIKNILTNERISLEFELLCICVCFLQLLNITMGLTRLVGEPKVSVDIIFAMRDGRDYLLGSEVSEHLRKLSQVEFSFYIGFPALQIAERKTCTDANNFYIYMRYMWCVICVKCTVC